MSYQPEERYWTDYLRIALPVVGLLLMLGLFWYWASAVIGDGNEEGPPADPTNNVAIITEPTLTPTQTVEVALVPETAVVEPTPDETDEPVEETPETAETEEPADETEPAEEEEDAPEAAGKGFVAGDMVVTNTGDVRLRAEGNTDGEIIDTLAEDTLLEVLEPATREVDNYYWVYVETPNGQEGYVADELLDLAD